MRDGSVALVMRCLFCPPDESNSGRVIGGEPGVAYNMGNVRSVIKRLRFPLDIMAISARLLWLSTAFLLAPKSRHGEQRARRPKHRERRYLSQVNIGARHIRCGVLHL